MIGWFMVLSFVLGFGLTWVYVVRSVSRTVDPVDARRVAGTAGRPLVRQRRVSTARDSDLDSALIHRPGAGIPARLDRRSAP